MLCPNQLHEAGEGSILPLALGIQYAPRTYRDWPDKKEGGLKGVFMLEWLKTILGDHYKMCIRDRDNIVKAVADALNGVAYRDDSAIVEPVS